MKEPVSPEVAELREYIKELRYKLQRAHSNNRGHFCGHQTACDAIIQSIESKEKTWRGL